jgi:hypothetical protein
MDALTALVRKRTSSSIFSNRWRALMITLAAPILIAGFFGAVLAGHPASPRLVRWRWWTSDAKPRVEGGSLA